MEDKINKITFFIQRNLSAAVLAVLVLMLVIPLPALVLEVWIGLELAFALGILIYSLTKQKVVMPKLVLYFTLFNLAINISLTRFALIGFQNKEQIPLIQFIGNMIGASHPVISMIIAVILLTVAVIIVAKGSSRVAEVAARFALESTNQKFVAIDNRLSSKEITEEETKRLKEKVRQEMDFYSCMDGSSRFLKGNVKGVILVTVVNFIGGILIQLLICKRGFQPALESVTVIVSGKMIVTSIPILIVGIAIGYINQRTLEDVLIYKHTRIDHEFYDF